ncbi:MAG: superoxide dismutase, Ni [Chloroflexi bacterium]|nr:superoxide dismutase, Ni [Chloroflexota bacterium]MDA1218619.1 superoxide dismutase, Ni [Chloroflexota bacterium]
MFNPLRFLKVQKAEAHCDIPCGIYDPVSAKIAAQTVQKMVLRIQALQPAGTDAAAMAAYANTLSRYVAVKEDHAEICKHELTVLWADYGWPNLPAGFDLHQSFNQALKLAGRCKQNVDMAACEELVATVDTIATAFWATKNVQYSDPHAAARYGA